MQGDIHFPFASPQHFVNIYRQIIAWNYGGLRLRGALVRNERKNIMLSFGI